MSKKIITILIGILLLSQVIYADTTYVDLSEDLLDNNGNLIVLENTVKKTAIDVNNAKFNAKAFQSTLDDLKDLPFPIPTATKAGLRYGIIIGPMQADYGYFAVENNQKITENTLKMTMRDLIVGYINAENTYALNLEKNTFYQKQYEDSLIKYDLGSISQTDLLNSEVKALEAKVNLDSSARSFEGIKMNLNKLVGNDLDTTYSFERETQMKNILSDPDVLVQSALKNRFEVLDIKEQIKLQQAIADFYNYGDYLTIFKNSITYRNALNKVEELTLSLQLEEEKITREIHKAYEAIILDELKIEQLKNSITMQEKELMKLKEQAAVGNITEARYKELEFVIKGLKGNLDTLVYSYNTKMHKLQNALYVGPAFGGRN